MTEQRLDFVIVGTPRSGTTLVQRLANELRGVTTPPESHVLVDAGYGHVHAGEFPLVGDRLHIRARELVTRHQADGIALDPAEVVRRLDGRAATIFELFEAIVLEMAGPAECTGEKTPEHLVWWRSLTRRWPHLKVIAVVRDPRAVVASNLAVPFGLHHAELIAARWALDQDEVLAAERTLAPERFMLVRYEDVVDDFAQAREHIAAFLDRPADVKPEDERRPIAVEREWWKDEVERPENAEPAAPPRPLTATETTVVRALTRRHLDRFGYGTAPGATDVLATLVRLSPLRWARLARYRIERRRRQRAIARFDVTTPRPHAETQG